MSGIMEKINILVDASELPKWWRERVRDILIEARQDDLNFIFSRFINDPSFPARWRDALSEARREVESQFQNLHPPHEAPQ